MKISQELKEILAYLEPRNDYVIWAGFAVFGHLKVAHSADVDIYVSSPEAKKEISAEFQKRGWQKLPHKEVVFDWDKLEKNQTSFDIVYSKPASRLLFSDAANLKAYGHKLCFLSKEWLFLTKLGQLTYDQRKLEKRKRDIVTLQRLRKSMDTKKVARLATKLPLSFWQSGDI
jgi:hypothetical protein